VITDPRPIVDCGRHPAKAVIGDVVPVSATIVRDGHEVLRAAVRTKAPGSRTWMEFPMRWVEPEYGGNHWEGSFPVDRLGKWCFTIEAWTDPWAAWRDEIARKVEAGQADLAGEFSEGRVLLEQAAERATGDPKRRIEATLAEELTPDAALDPVLAAAVDRHPERHELTPMDKTLDLWVDTFLAQFGAWYELFPRSWGGFRGVTELLPRFAELGVDVLYFPPIHPIGRKNRKGRNNALTAGPDDPGSPWAIGDETGGHKAIDPELGTEDDFRTLVTHAREHFIEIALDFAIQCSADHPWLKEHPEWFQQRPDGTLKYAENPPKKYQDIYNVNWESPDWRGLWDALLDVVQHWIGFGVRVFRVDNPHTKPLPFWEWLIGEVHKEHPEIVFLSEAFTKQALMDELAKVGFSQSYTYFPWKNGAWELRQYVEELIARRDFLRPSFWVNTPDILTAYLVEGGPTAFHVRLVLAGTLSPAYGIYSGFEHYENTPVRPGSEEYLNSEKYEAKQRRLDGPLLPVVHKLNTVRRRHPALQHLANVRFLGTENEHLVAYVKTTGTDTVITVVNIDPFSVQEGIADIPYESGLPPAYEVRDALTGEQFTWYVGRNFVRLNPGGAHVMEVL
jgi:starch synthase (maltosyl-transferring)